MKTFQSIKLEKIQVLKEIEDLENLLKSTEHLKERDQVLPFFKERHQLCGALGLVNGKIGYADKVATELNLFGDMVCDAACGDSRKNAYVLIEFEDAKPYSIFKASPEGKSSIRPWSARFEHGFSQLVDWAWRIEEEYGAAAYRRLFGTNAANILLMLVVGRDSDLTQEDIDRLNWRSHSLSIGKFKMECWTYDTIVESLRRKIEWTELV